PRHADVTQMRAASERRVIAHEELAAPDRAVAPEARAVEGDADDRARKFVLRHATGEVRMVMLDCEKGASFLGRPFSRVAGRGVIGVQVVRQNLGSDGKQLLVERDVRLEGAVGGIMVEVAEVVAEKGLAVAAEGEGTLELPADG